LTGVDKIVNEHHMRATRPISWLKAALRDFEAFPAAVQREVLRALTVAAEGGKSDKAKPFKGVDSGYSKSRCGTEVTRFVQSTRFGSVPICG
jgi:phage-related protein